MSGGALSRRDRSSHRRCRAPRAALAPGRVGPRGGGVRVLRSATAHPRRRDRPLRRPRRRRRRAGRGARRPRRVAAAEDDGRLPGRLRASGPPPARGRRRPVAWAGRRSRRWSTRSAPSSPAATSTRSASRRFGSTPTLGRAPGPRRPAERQPSIAPWTRRRLVLPGSFEEFVASRSSNTRWRIRRDATPLSPSSATAHGESSATRPGSTGSSATPTASRGRPTSGRSAPASPTRRSSASSRGRPRARLGSRLPALSRRRADRVLALLRPTAGRS